MHKIIYKIRECQFCLVMSINVIEGQSKIKQLWTMKKDMTDTCTTERSTLCKHTKKNLNTWNLLHLFEKNLCWILYNYSTIECNMFYGILKIIVTKANDHGQYCFQYHMNSMKCCNWFTTFHFKSLSLCPDLTDI